jgi:hypothetical protein
VRASEYLFRPSELERIDSGMFHVTAHALDDLFCFRDREDMREFLFRFERALSPRVFKDAARRPYRKYSEGSSLVAFCLLENHYHLILRQFSAGGARKLMDSVLNSYGQYFNRKYGRANAPIWREEYTATWIASARQGMRTVSYVTMNHEIQRERYEFSSYDYYVGRRRADWLDVESGLWFFGGDAGAFKQYVFGEGTDSLERKIAGRAAKPLPPRHQLKRGRATHIARPPTNNPHT